MSDKRFDVVCLGRAAVDLYGEQIGASLEDTQTFAKYVGGCAANIAIGCSRLGLRTALISRVGDEAMGRFVRQTLVQERVDVDQVTTDPDRLTGLVLLGMRDQSTFPLLFYRQDCADMNLRPEDLDPEAIGQTHALVVTGTHFSQPQADAASRAAIEYARQGDTRVVMDLDFRPRLWRSSPLTQDQEFSSAVSHHYLSVVPDCDLVVGTEEEMQAAGGSEKTVTALKKIREQTAALLVVKRGAEGCVAFADAIPSRLDAGDVHPGFPVEVLNLIGAGDAFMAGFLKGWIRNEPLARCCEYGNTSGALVVTRHGCAPAMPSESELQTALNLWRGATPSSGPESTPKRRIPTQTLERLHYVSTPPRSPVTNPELVILAVDHRPQLESLAAQTGDVHRLHRLKTLFAQGGRRGAKQADLPPSVGWGMIIDRQWGQNELNAWDPADGWIARPIEKALTDPLEFAEGENVGLSLRGWPAHHVVKCLVRYNHDDKAAFRRTQLRRLSRLYEAVQTTGHRMVLEVIPREGSGRELARALEHIYEQGIQPDWWKLPAPRTSADWRPLSRTIDRHDPDCLGVLILGGGSSPDALREQFTAAAGAKWAQGFAVGRTIWAPPAEGWLSGQIDDETVVQDIADRFAEVIGLWLNRSQVDSKASNKRQKVS